MATKDQIKALRKALRMTQDQVADASGGNLTRPDVVKVEGGTNQARTDRVRAGLALAFGLSRDALAAYLEGTADLEQTLRLRTMAATSTVILYDHEDPELRAAVEFRRGRYEDEYLQMFASSHAKDGAEGRKSREQYVVDIDNGYAAWRGREAREASAMPRRELPHDDTFDEPRQLPAPAKKSAAKKARGT